MIQRFSAPSAPSPEPALWAHPRNALLCIAATPLCERDNLQAGIWQILAG